MVSELAPGFLVASPSLTDPNFRHAVVLLIEHRSEGSLGFVVNRPARIDFRTVIEELGLLDELENDTDVPVLAGGPVARNTGWIVSSSGTLGGGSDDTISVTERLHVSASKEQLQLLAASGARRGDEHVLVLGYAGWGAGQLDEEIRQGAWIPVGLPDGVLFGTAPEDRWQTALQSSGINPLCIAGSSPSMQS